MMPGMNSNGMKTAISDRLIDTTVKAICFAPSSVASIRPMPRSTCASTFSIITMASSTTKPTEMVSAISDRLSIENPAAHIAAQEPTSDSGTVMPAASTGESRRRNSNTTAITRQTVMNSVR